MLTLNFSPFPEISTERLFLRKLEMNDVKEIYFLRSDENVMRYIDRPPAKSQDEAAGFIKKILNFEENNETVTWGITLKEDPRVVGTIGYWNIQKEHYRAEIAYILHPGFWGKGIMQEAFNEVLKFGFQVMNLHSIEANVNPANKSSIKLLERNNFKREAYFRENYFYDGKFIDTVIYSLLANEYKKGGG